MMRISHKTIYQAFYVQGRIGCSGCYGRGPADRASPSLSQNACSVSVQRRQTTAPGWATGKKPLSWDCRVLPTAVYWNARRVASPSYSTCRAWAGGGHVSREREKSGSALARHGAEAVCKTIAQTIGTLPEQLRRLNTQPGKMLGRKTPDGAWEAFPRSAHTGSVATLEPGQWASAE